MITGYEIRYDASKRAWLTGASRRVIYRLLKKPSRLMLDYYRYTNRININERINNRSWLADSVTGSMVLSYTYARRNMRKSEPYQCRPKYGIAIFYYPFP